MHICEEKTQTFTFKDEQNHANQNEPKTGKFTRKYGHGEGRGQIHDQNVKNIQRKKQIYEERETRKACLRPAVRKTPHFMQSLKQPCLKLTAGQYNETSATQTKEAEVGVKGATGFLTRMVATGGGSVSQGCGRTNAAAEDRRRLNGEESNRWYISSCSVAIPAPVHAGRAAVRLFIRY